MFVECDIRLMLVMAKNKPLCAHILSSICRNSIRFLYCVHSVKRAINKQCNFAQFTVYPIGQSSNITLNQIYYNSLTYCTL